LNTHQTKGVVLRTVHYGDTSVIASVYTELFGLQSYIVKGIRKSTKKSAGKGNYFQPGALLDMNVYHNEMKQLQFIKEFEWSYIYQTVFFDIVKNAVATFIVEMSQHTLKQPEANPELFYLIEDSLKQLDKGNTILTANLPVYFSLHLASELGFGIQGEYNSTTPVIDLMEGNFVHQIPDHSYYASQEVAKTISQFLQIQFYNDLEKIEINRNTRRQLISTLHQFIALHVQDFGEMRSLAIMQEVLS
jgi:DNA repair protein RecO (recombination protein O)